MAAALCSWEDNLRSGIILAMHHRLCHVPLCGPNGLERVMSTSPMLRRGMAPSTFNLSCTCTFQEHQFGRIQGCLNWLHLRAMCGPNRFKIRFLEDLSLELFAHANKNVSESSIRNMLTTSAFDYEPNTRYCTNRCVKALKDELNR